MWILKIKYMYIYAGLKPKGLLFFVKSFLVSVPNFIFLQAPEFSGFQFKILIENA